MSTRLTHRSRVVVTVAILVVAFGALGASVAGLAGKDDEVAVNTMTEIERLAPVDTSQLVLTPGLGKGNEWWSTVIAFMPVSVKLDNLSPTPDLGIIHLGYSFSAASPTLELDQRYVRMLYVETDSAAHARKVEGWLSSSRGAAASAFSTTISGHTVVLAPSNIPVLSQLPSTGDGLGGTAAYRQDTAKRGPGSLIWEDWGAYVKAAGASGGKPAEYSQYFHGATGFVEGSRWVGYSTSPEAGWSGKFQSGGMDAKLVSATKVADAVWSYNKVLHKDQEGVPLVSDLGAGNYLRHGFYAKHPDLTGDDATMGSPDLAFRPRSEGDTAFAFDPSTWLAGTSVTGTAGPEGISLFAYSINGDEINLEVTVQEVSKTPDNTPTFAPPPEPPPGSVPVPDPSGEGG